MAVELVILVLLLLLSIGSFVFGILTDNKIFVLACFVLLMFTGVFLQSSGGVITGHYYSDNTGVLVLNNIIVGLEEPMLYIFSQILFFVGLVVSAWIGLVGAFGKQSKSNSPFNF